MSKPALSNDKHVDKDAATSSDGAKKILFHYPVLNRGGAEKSLLRLMAGLANRGHEVHLVLTSAGGALESEIDSRISLYHLRGVRTLDVGSGGAVRRALMRPVRVLRWMVGRLQEVRRRRQFQRMTFDAAFAGLTGLSPDFICTSVQARKRFVFVRSDPATDKSGRWSRRIREFHKRIDAYVCVSDYVNKAMAARFPEITEKLITIYNLLDAKGMRAKAAVASDPFPETSGVLRVLSVCRLQELPKALLRMVEVHRRLLDAGLPHVWHVLGDGPDRALVESAIAEFWVTGTFKLHGDVADPFPYYKHADICAVLSRFEGLSGAVNEARVMERPVIATRFSGIEEQITNGVNGLIVAQNVDAIVEGMTSLMTDPALRLRLAKGGYPDTIIDDEGKIQALNRLMG